MLRLPTRTAASRSCGVRVKEAASRGLTAVRHTPSDRTRSHHQPNRLTTPVVRLLACAWPPRCGAYCSILLPHRHRRVGRRVHVAGGHALDVGSGDLGDLSLEPIGIVQAEAVLLDADQEVPDLLRCVEPEGEAPDQVGLGKLELPLLHRRPANAGHLLLPGPPRLPYAALLPLKA